MKNLKMLLIAAIVILVLKPDFSFAGVDFILGLNPGSCLFSSDVDEFTVKRKSGGSYYSWTEIEEIEGVGSYIPNLKMGIGISVPGVYIDLTAGAGFLWNDAFYSGMLMGDTALRFKLGPHFTFGPHFTIVSFNPSWDGEADIEFDDEIGYMIGPCFTVGGKIASFAMSIDYVSASFDLKTKGGWVPSDNTLDISGVAIQMGVLFRF